MAGNQFAIERPRKISISIQGYDALTRVGQQKKRQLNAKLRMQRKVANREKAQVPQKGKPPADIASNKLGAALEVVGAASPAVAVVAAPSAANPASDGPTELELMLGPVFAESDIPAGEPR